MQLTHFFLQSSDPGLSLSFVEGIFEKKLSCADQLLIFARQCNLRCAFTHRFDPGQSLSFAEGHSKTFSLSYADQSLITGYVGRDIVQLGSYYTMTRFGCALDCNDPHFNGIDGILGMGMPDASLPDIPTPLLFALASDRGGIEGANYINERPLHTRKFTFLSTADAGELQLGGYDRASTNADMVYVPTTSTTEYSVNVQVGSGAICQLGFRGRAGAHACVMYVSLTSTV